MERKEKHIRKLLFAVCVLGQATPIGYFLHIAQCYQNKRALLMFLIGTLFSILIDYVFFQKVLKNMDKEYIREKYEMIQYRKEIQMKYVQDKKNEEEQNERFRNKLLEQLQEIRDRIQSPDEVEQSVNMFRKTLDIMKQEYFCENMIVNIILADKKRCAREKKILFRAAVNVPKDLPIQSTDLCSVLGNLLDNAIEASENLAVCEKREVFVKCIMKEKYLIVKVENTCNPSALLYDTKVYRTTKKDKKKHGIGMHIIKAVVKKYDGQLIVQQEGDQFTVIAYLNCGKEGGIKDVG